MECPACGGPVTLEIGPEHPLSTSLTDAVLAADVDECIEVERICWDCGWQEARHLRIESIATSAGDKPTIKRASLIEEITDQLEAIDSLATLEDALGEIRRQRRRDSETANTEDSSKE